MMILPDQVNGAHAQRGQRAESRHGLGASPRVRMPPLPLSPPLQRQRIRLFRHGAVNGHDAIVTRVTGFHRIPEFAAAGAAFAAAVAVVARMRRGAVESRVVAANAAEAFEARDGGDLAFVLVGGGGAFLVVVVVEEALERSIGLLALPQEKFAFDDDAVEGALPPPQIRHRRVLARNFAL